MRKPNVGDVVAVASATTRDRNALVVRVWDDEFDSLGLVAVSPHEGDVGHHGRLTEVHATVPHQRVALDKHALHWRHLEESAT